MDQFTDSILGALPDQIFCAADVIVTGGQILAHRASVLDQALVQFRYELFDGVSTRKRRGLCQHCKQCDQKKIAKCLSKLPKNDFTRKMIYFDTSTKNA